METIWKDVKGYEGYYQVSNTGEARSLDRVIRNGRGNGFHVRKGVNLNLGNTDDGYPMFIACVNKVSKPVLVHRAMMEAFVPNPQNLPCVNHKDENPSNNFIFVNPDGSVDLEKSNLEWCTYEYNANYGTNGKRIEENISKKVLQYTMDGVLVKEFPSIRKAQLSLGGKGDVKYALNKSKNNYSQGYIWKYKE